MSRHDNNRYRDRSPVTLWAPDAGHPDAIGLRSIGFWLYMMSDAMIFAALFAAHGVYTHAYGTSDITASQVIDPVEGLLPTLFLFTSVLMYGLASVALKNDDRAGVVRWMGASLGLGVLFLLVEVWEFAGLVGEGAVPQASAFLSDFWTIVWVHGGHVFVGLIWMAAMLIQISREGFTETVVGRFINLRIFWFFQAVIWVCVYTYVYLMGAS
ncbi:cytochrome c oxidase subunit 3 [Salinisphaera hydrothermalis]|uniref:Cytochrome c oxidase subunit III n=1 Tax=Salinisphaera hydrothermalis (strain C41B8) TaxID=1304275 RepID=A0A084IGF8_SALHC|nr:cytochrome c oxidase subunit 3 [Salinisphaera hydrothermalis]KEZ75792.1 cytochrome c oxidase subunit III [Salinisphaera hydrothermalis C41B8]